MKKIIIIFMLSFTLSNVNIISFRINKHNIQPTWIKGKQVIIYNYLEMVA